MRFSQLALLATASAASALAQATQDAPVVANNPLSALYIATLPTNKGTTRGAASGVSAADGKGVIFSVSISGLPSEGGPFMYHIHEKPVPADGNCTGTGAHLDPYKRGEVPPCDASKPETCQTGDLSGKYGNITTMSDSIEFLDLYSSTNPSDPSFFGDKSIVFHYSNKTRITCANFTLQHGGIVSSALPSSGYALPTGSAVSHGNSSYVKPTPSGTGSPSKPSSDMPTFTSAAPTQPSPQPTTGGANKVMGAGAAVMAGLLAVLL